MSCNCPPSLPLWSQPPAGVTSHLGGTEKGGGIYGPITGRRVKPPSAGHCSISYTLSWGGEHWAGANSKLQGCKHTHTHTISHTTERERETLTCSLPLQSLNAECLALNKYSLQREKEFNPPEPTLCFSPGLTDNPSQIQNLCGIQLATVGEIYRPGLQDIRKTMVI